MTNPRPSDAELVERARNESEDAFSVLVERHHGPVFGVAYAWTGNRQDAEDLAQEALYVAFERLRSLRDPAAFAGWLLRITRNLCRMWRRSTAEVISLDDPESAGYAVVASSSPCPVDELEDKQRRAAVRAALGTLPESMGQAAALFYLEGLSLRLIGAVLGVPVSTVKIRLFRARKLIRQHGLAPLRDVYTPTAKEKSMHIMPAEGILSVHQDGYGFLRPSVGAAPAATDIYVSASQIHRFELTEGARVVGHARPPKGDESYDALLRIDAVDGSPREPTTRPATGFLHPDERGWGFLRPTAGAVGCRDDVYVSARQVGTGSLQAGDRIEGFARPPKGDESYWALIKITRVNGGAV